MLFLNPGLIVLFFSSWIECVLPNIVRQNIGKKILLFSMWIKLLLFELDITEKMLTLSVKYTV